ncbi:MAG: HD domain-containing protein, partial [Isosphaeraceae bacterium]
ESVADHTFGTAVLALVLGPQLGVDVSRLVRLALVHDLAECDPGVGDITPYCGIDRAEKRRLEREAIDRLSALLPGGDALRDLWLEYEGETTPEARLVHELDALDMALQADAYQRRYGVDLAEFNESARRKISHPLLSQILDALAVT